MTQDVKMAHSSLDVNSNMIYCTNSQALKRGLTKVKYEVKHCRFCGKALEAIGFYVPNSYLNHWINGQEYEKCDCQKSKDYWETLKKQEEKQRIKEIKERDEKEYQKRLNFLIENSHLGKRFYDRTFSTFIVDDNNRRYYETCQRYAQKFKEVNKDGIGIILTGGYGVGKTHLAAAIAHELMKQGYQPIFGTLINLLDRVKSTYNTSESKETEQNIIDSYINCSLLIIDDLGKEKPSEWTLEKLYQVFNSRYEDNKPIIITTNYSMNRLIERLTVNNNTETAEAIVSRIYEMCQGIDMQGKDYRKL